MAPADEVTTAHARGCILRALKTWLDRERPAGDDSGVAYMSEELVQAHLARFFRLPMMPGELRGMLTYLLDAGMVKYRETVIGSRTYLSWRIMHDGIQVLEGLRRDPGIQA